MRLYNKSQLISLKAKIKGLTTEGRRTRKFISNSEGDLKDHYWYVKRNIGEEARYHLLAYGLLRGIPYTKLEPNVSEEKMMYFDYGYLAQICQRHCARIHMSTWTPANIKRLIQTGTIMEPVKPVARIV